MRRIFFFFTCALVASVGIAVTDTAGPYSWNNNIDLISRENCYECHCSIYRFLCDYEQALAYICVDYPKTKGTPLVYPGHPDSSCIVWRIEGRLPTGEEIVYMPQGSDRLPDESIAVIREWIAQGAPKSLPVEVKPEPWGNIKRWFSR